MSDGKGPGSSCQHPGMSPEVANRFLHQEPSFDFWSQQFLLGLSCLQSIWFSECLFF